MTGPIRIGGGAGYAGDRVTPAVELVESAPLDYLALECLGERTIALAQRDRLSGGTGYNPRLDERMRALLPACAGRGVTVVTNMGAANPAAAAAATRAIAREAGLPDLRVACVEGDDVTDRLDELGPETVGGEPLDAYRADAISATAYLGAEGIRAALAADADVVVTGRVADPSLFLGPALHEFGWSLEPLGEPAAVGGGLAAGHLLECAGQVTGGYFADPGHKEVAGLGRLGFPYGVLDADGGLTIATPEATGGAVTERTCKEQLLYEVHDPAAYVTPDAVADFSRVRLAETGPDRVAVRGASASPRPETLRVNVGYRDGVAAEASIGYAGPGARDRARLAGEVVRTRLDTRGLPADELRTDLVGVDSIHAAASAGGDPYEVRLRVAARCPDRDAARGVGREVETLYTNGPAGGGGVRRDTREVIGVVSTTIRRSAVEPTVDCRAAGDGEPDDGGVAA